MSFEATNESLDKRVKACCAPLFANQGFLQRGHNHNTLNATVTFVKRRDRYYAVTCHHVLEAFRNAAIRSRVIVIPSLHAGRSVWQFGTWVGIGVNRWSFSSCREFIEGSLIDDEDAIAELMRRNAEKPDIAVADVSEVWEVLAKRKELTPIDLDDWSEPVWANIGSLWGAYGYPNDHKHAQNQSVVAPLARILAKLETAHPSPEHSTFSLYSTLEDPHSWGFSGVSGGPVIIENTATDLFDFIGIVYEGAPSAAETAPSSNSIFGQSDIFLWCYLLSPSTFDSWLGSLSHGVSLTT